LFRVQGRGGREKKSAQLLFEDTHIISEAKTPHLATLFESSTKVPKGHLNALLLEILKVMGNKSNAVDFEYRNGNRGHAVIVPRVKSLDSFKKQAKRSNWIKSLLEHIAGEDSVEDAAQWLITHLGKQYEASFTLASEALGLPLVERMDAAAAEAMWSDANVNVVQQWIIRRHLKYHFGKWLFIPRKIFEEDREHYNAQTYYDCYKYYKGGDKQQKPEKCPYWCRNPDEVVSKELTKLLDYIDPNLITTGLSSICQTACTIVAGVATESGLKIRERMATEQDFDPKTSCIVFQVAHITCKKDHHKILSATVSDRLSTGYEKLQSSYLVFIQPPSSKIKAVYISRHAFDVQLELDGDDVTKCHPIYVLSSNEENGFSMKPAKNNGHCFHRIK
jgi:hypothetical protein